jgi:hypothetical protein
MSHWGHPQLDYVVIAAGALTLLIVNFHMQPRPLHPLVTVAMAGGGTLAVFMLLRDILNF